jgi:hypothetical protein
LDFLDSRGFDAKPPISDYWILLDFLGFSRPNHDLSMGYARFSRVKFSPPFSPRLRGVDGERRGQGHAEGRNVHEPSLAVFLIARKTLLTLALAGVLAVPGLDPGLTRHP